MTPSEKSYSGRAIGSHGGEERYYTIGLVREVAYQAAGAGACAVMKLAPEVVMPTEDIEQAVETILGLLEAGEL